MIIQSGYGTLAYSGIATASTQRQDGKMASVAIADPAKMPIRCRYPVPATHLLRTQAI